MSRMKKEISTRAANCFHGYLLGASIGFKDWDSWRNRDYHYKTLIKNALLYDYKKLRATRNLGNKVINELCCLTGLDATIVRRQGKPETRVFAALRGEIIETLEGKGFSTFDISRVLKITNSSYNHAKFQRKMELIKKGEV